MVQMKISSRQIAVAFTGSFLGAGFVSGQELMQFFATFGGYGLLGMALAIVLFFLLGNFAMIIGKRTGFRDFDKIIVKREHSWLRGFFTGVFIIFLFGVVVIMTAGSGALLNQLFAIPKIVGSGIMVIILAIVALWEAKGVLTAFSITVPLLILIAVVTSILSFISFEGIYPGSRPYSDANPLLSNWLFSMTAFVSYNMIAAISVLVPIATDVSDEKTIRKGIRQGTVLLMIIFTCILLPLIFHNGMIKDAQLPMLKLAEAIHPLLGMAYAVLLFFGMFGSALSCLFGINIRIKRFRNRNGRSINGRTSILVLVTLAFIISMAGFKELIAVLLPICGYLSFFAMIGIGLHYYALRKENSLNNQTRSA